MVKKIRFICTVISRAARAAGINRFAIQTAPVGGTGLVQPSAWRHVGGKRGAHPALYPDGSTVAKHFEKPAVIIGQLDAHFHTVPVRQIFGLDTRFAPSR